MFPLIKTIDDVRPAIAGRTEFVVAERDWGFVIDYQVSLQDTFPAGNDMRRECRGIKFDRDGNIIGRPLHKFFNLGEKESAKQLGDDGRFEQNFDVLQKLDGSMIHPILWDDEVWFCTRMGINEISDQAATFVGDRLDPEWESKKWYLDFCYDMMQSGYTPIFEWCSLSQRIVIFHDKPSLTLLAIRHMNTGEYLTRGKMRALAEPYNIPMVGLFEHEWTGIDTLSRVVRDLEGEEGVVIRWHDGHSIKLKGEWYLAIHRNMDEIRFEKRVVGLVVNNQVDDMIPFLLPPDAERLLRYQTDFWANIDAKVEWLKRLVTEARLYADDQGYDDKAGRIYFKETHVDPRDVNWSGILWALWNRKDAREAILTKIKKEFMLDVVGAKRGGTGNRVTAMRELGLLPEKAWEKY